MLSTPLPTLGPIENRTLSALLDAWRVASLAPRGDTYPWLGLDNNHPGWTHSAPGDPGMIASATKFSTWCATQLLCLLQQLAGIKEGDGTLLEHTVLLWSTEVAEGESHSHDNMPWTTYVTVSTALVLGGRGNTGTPTGAASGGDTTPVGSGRGGGPSAGANASGATPGGAGPNAPAGGGATSEGAAGFGR